MRKKHGAVISLVALAVLVSGACGKDYREMLEKKGIPFTGETFLEEARSGNRGNVELFLKAGMDVDTRDKDLSTALMIATERDDVDMVRLLVARGADVNAANVDGYTALMYAAYRGNREIVELLVKNNAAVDSKDKDGWTALRYASVRGRSDIVDMLKKARDKK